MSSIRYVLLLYLVNLRHSENTLPSHLRYMATTPQSWVNLKYKVHSWDYGRHCYKHSHTPVPHNQLLTEKSVNSSDLCIPADGLSKTQPTVFVSPTEPSSRFLVNGNNTLQPGITWTEKSVWTVGTGRALEMICASHPHQCRGQEGMSVHHHQKRHQPHLEQEDVTVWWIVSPCTLKPHQQSKRVFLRCTSLLTHPWLYRRS